MKPKKKQIVKLKRQLYELNKVGRFPLQMVPTTEPECGECTACCTAVGVAEIEKKPGEHCKHLHATTISGRVGCRIYNQRPESCRSYKCFWRSGHLKGEEYRPDKIGLILDNNTVGDNPIFIGGWELREGIIDQDGPASRLLKELGEVFVVYIRRFNGKRRIYGPAKLLKDIGIIKELS